MSKRLQWWEHPLDQDAPNEFPKLPAKLRRYTMSKVVYPGLNLLLNGFDALWSAVSWLLRVRGRDD